MSAARKARASLANKGADDANIEETQPSAKVEKATKKQRGGSELEIETNDKSSTGTPAPPSQPGDGELSPAGEASASAQPMTLQFKKDEKVLCYHGPLLYEAKILKAEIWDGATSSKKTVGKKGAGSKANKNKDGGLAVPGPRYEIHYKGWKQRWDEWVTGDRVLKWTQENLELQQQLNEGISTGGTKKTTNVSSTSAAQAPKSPATPMSRPLRTTTKPNTPSQTDNSPPSALSPETLNTVTPRPKRKTQEVPEFKSKRLQAMRTTTNSGESPKSAPEQEASISRARPTSLRSAVQDPETPAESSPSQNHSDSEKRPKRKDPLPTPAPVLETRPQMELPIPDSLKVYLVDQWELITRGMQLVPLPRNPSIRQILADYLTYATSTILEEARLPRSAGLASSLPNPVSTQLDILHEVVDGLGLYFTKTLGTFLLYRFERPQHASLLSLYPRAQSLAPNLGDEEAANIKKPKKGKGQAITAPTGDNSNDERDLLDLYGAEHLLRLFVYLPILLSRSDLDLHGVQRVQTPLIDLLKYLADHQGELFLKEYETAPPAYVNSVRAE